MDKLYLKGLRIYAYHGVNPEEKLQGQPFLLDIRIKADLAASKKSDRLSDTINYAAVRKTVQRVFTAQSDDLIEHAAKRVCEAVLWEYPKVEEIRLRLKKPEAPMNADFDYVAVEITEKREAECH